ncbi:MAG TPA: hypothetical protein VI589_15390 [Vicinamibacteria bacterium]
MPDLVSPLEEKLRGLYGPDEDLSLRATAGGLWHATPLGVLGATVAALAETGLLVPGALLFDAGMGDGRVLAALALGLPAALRPRLAGLESDEDLAREARRRLHALEAGTRTAGSLRVARGDYFHPRYHEALGHRPSDLDLVFNYPDGNESRLLEWLGAHGKPTSRLVIVGPDRDPRPGCPPLLLREVRPAGSDVAWTLAVFVPPWRPPVRAPGTSTE